MHRSIRRCFSNFGNVVFGDSISAAVLVDLGVPDLPSSDFLTEDDLCFIPLVASDIDELESLLRVDAVYKHIEATPNSVNFRQGLMNAIAGPTPEYDEYWLNFVARIGGFNGPIVGRLEATIHDGIAETAFLLGPQYWGRGFARRGLKWLHSHINNGYSVRSFWATVAPENARSEILLMRCGYRLTTEQIPSLLSFEPGDRVYTLKN